MLRHIDIKLNWRIAYFFILLEGVTVPMVAMSNSWILKGTYYVMVLGFLIALIAVYFLLRLLRNMIIKHSVSMIDVQATSISHLWYIAVISGILEMVMFVVQDTLFRKGFGDWSAGFWSAFISVGVSLLIYQIVFLISRFGVSITTDKERLVVIFRFVDILKISFIFGIYELVVCPITGWWIPYYGWQRFGVAILSAVVGATVGSFLITFIARFNIIRPKVTLYNY